MAVKAYPHLQRFVEVPGHFVSKPVELLQHLAQLTVAAIDDSVVELCDLTVDEFKDREQHIDKLLGLRRLWRKVGNSCGLRLLKIPLAAHTPTHRSQRSYWQTTGAPSSPLLRRRLPQSCSARSLTSSGRCPTVFVSSGFSGSVMLKSFFCISSPLRLGLMVCPMVPGVPLASSAHSCSTRLTSP